jgi:tRNA nucleotidyltransferase (CCA-adding enzyme)
LSIFSFSRQDLVANLELKSSAAQRSALQAARTAAREVGAQLYLVGGSVRDLVLGLPSVDLDLSTDGDHAAIARRAADAVGATVKVYGRFGTTSVLDEDLRVDLARLRGETYRRPGALPSVYVADLEADLWRRDITINAMALGLGGAQEGQLFDPTGGLNDLNGRLVRVIHEQSFVDDATRILRALRYASRLDFEVEAQTANLAREQAHYLETISGSRLRAELMSLLGDKRPWVSLGQAAELGVLNALYAGLHWDERCSEIARGWEDLPRQQRLQRLLVVLAARVQPGAASELGQRLALGSGERRLVRQAGEFFSQSSQVPSLAPLDRALWVRSFQRPVVAALADLVFSTDEAVALKKAYVVRQMVTGRDLLAMGVPEGPTIGLILDSLLRARLAGAVRSKNDELALARTLIAAERDNK